MVYFILLFTTGALVLNAVVGDSGVLTRLREGRQQRELAADVERLRAENAKLKQEVRRLRNDPAAVEEIARDKLGLIRPGEKLFILADPKR